MSHSGEKEAELSNANNRLKYYPGGTRKHIALFPGILEQLAIQRGGFGLQYFRQGKRDFSFFLWVCVEASASVLGSRSFVDKLAS